MDKATFEQDREQRRKWLRQASAAGNSTRHISGLLPKGTKGASPTNIGLELKLDAEECLEKLSTRRFDGPDDPPIVAAYLDATWVGEDGKEDGKRKKKEEGKSNRYEVMIIVGVRADGTKVPLNAGVTKDERSDDIHPLLADVVKRGVDPRILWIADHRSGIRKALERLTFPDPPNRQGCTTHAAGNMAALLPKEFSKAEKKAWRLPMYWAWSEEDVDVARTRLQDVVRDLKLAGHHSAARSVLLNMESTLTIIRYLPDCYLREQLRSTNPEESVNSLVKSKGSLSNLTYITDEPMALRHVAQRLIVVEEDSLNRLAEPERLVGMLDQLMPERWDVEALLERLPPSYEAKPLTVTFGDDERMLKIATDWYSENPEASWVGSQGALDALGLGTGREVTPETLVEAMRCRDPNGKSLRRSANVAVEHLDDEGNSVSTIVPGIRNLNWKLDASPSVMREWHKGGEAREKVEATFVKSASAAVDQGTRTTSEHHGFAGIMALRRPPPDQPEQPLRVAGIAFAVQRGRKAQLGSAAPDAALLPESARAAENAARDVLDGKPRELGTPAAEPSVSEPGRDGAALDPERAAPSPVSPELWDGVAARALEIAPRMIGADLEDLETHARGWPRLAKPSMGAIATEVRDWEQKNWQSAVRQIAVERARPISSAGMRQGVWRPLTPDQRLVLGEERSQRLLRDAALLAGRAEADPELARRLRRASEDPLTELSRPIARVKAAAEALAARRELDRRHQFEAARGARGEPSPVAPIEPYDGARGDDRGARRPALGEERREALSRYARALAPEVEEMGLPALQRLSVATRRAWDDFDPAEGRRFVGLEDKRDVLLGKELAAQRDYGREATLADRAEQARNGSAFRAADDRATDAKRRADDTWEELRELETKLSVGQMIETGPVILTRHPEAAIHHAVQVELLERARGLELPERPLTDSLRAALARGHLDKKTASAIWRRGRNAAISAKLGSLSEQELRKRLPAENPFEKRSAGPGDRAALSAWGNQHRDAAVRTAAIEGQLILNARRSYRNLAREESERLGDRSPHPMRDIRKVRSEQFANGVEHDAAVLASRLGSVSREDRRDMRKKRRNQTTELEEKIQRMGGFEKADRKHLARFVALKHDENVENARGRAAERVAAVPVKTVRVREQIVHDAGLDSGFP